MTSFNTVLMKFIDIVRSWNLPFSLLHHMPLCKCISLLTDSTADEHLGSFQILANTNRALTNILVCVCVYINVNYIIRSKIDAL